MIPKTSEPTLTLDLHTLSSGAHESLASGACLLELVSHLAGEAWSDAPPCTSVSLTSFGRSLNDALLPQRQDLEPRLRALAPHLIGTAGNPDADQRAGLLAADWLCRAYTPAWLRLASLITEAEALEQSPPVLAWDQMPTAALVAARKAAADATGWSPAAGPDWDPDTAWDNAWYAAGDAARDAALYAARDAALYAVLHGLPASAREAARDAAWDAAHAARDSARAAAVRAAWDGRSAPGEPRDVLRPTVTRLQDSALALLERMIAEY